MKTYQVLLAVPEHIHRGLATGEYVRNSAGVVRLASGGPQGGNIVAHLREIGPSAPAQSLAPSVLPGIATAAIQVMTLAYLKVRLDRLESQLTELIRVAQETISTVREIKELQFRGFTLEVARGVQFLQRYRGNNEPHLLEKTRDCFIRATGDIRHLIGTYDGEGLIANSPRLEPVLRMAALSCAAEMEALVEIGTPLQAQRAALSAHGELWSDTKAKIEAVPGSSRRVPTLEMLGAAPNQNPDRIKRLWVEGCQTMIDLIEGEAAFLEAAAGEASVLLGQWASEVQETGHGALCLLPMTVE